MSNSKTFEQREEVGETGLLSEEPITEKRLEAAVNFALKHIESSLPRKHSIKTEFKTLVNVLLSGESKNSLALGFLIIFLKSEKQINIIKDTRIGLSVNLKNFNSWHKNNYKGSLSLSSDEIFAACEFFQRNQMPRLMKIIFEHCDYCIYDEEFPKDAWVKLSELCEYKLMNILIQHSKKRQTFSRYHHNKTTKKEILRLIINREAKEIFQKEENQGNPPHIFYEKILPKKPFFLI